MASVTSPEDIVNLALVRIGYKMRVGSMFEGSSAAKTALEIYGQTRDACLREATWGFAKKIAPAVLSGNPAPPPWAFEYAYPTDCLQIRNMFGGAYAADRNDPLPVLYTVANDAPSKVIWANIGNLTLVYTARITDPVAWEPLFVEAFVARLATRLAAALLGADGAKMKIDDDKAMVEAEDRLG